jgi:hypothetical protein
LKNVNCAKCLTALNCDNVTHDDSEYLIYFKNFGDKLRLKNPSKKFYELALVWIQVFETVVYENPVQENIASRIIELCCNIIATNENYKWYDEFCLEHKDKILRRFVVVIHL